ncbi:hypothetical protein BS47DRAFT_1360449 [Hydnum rufescens UP504]|uniref:Uncharacterized protein n=1 Tax=Hydnum rufescens UP504 TaxID=1448309 RepID=A0A9P6DYS1_9AGAM|nr:hypothetical protein BS47DRAFT_1360449 [Hydnum rufescens UP504]
MSVRTETGLPFIAVITEDNATNLVEMLSMTKQTQGPVGWDENERGLSLEYFEVHTVDRTQNTVIIFGRRQIIRPEGKTEVLVEMQGMQTSHPFKLIEPLTSFMCMHKDVVEIEQRRRELRKQKRHIPKKDQRSGLTEQGRLKRAPKRGHGWILGRGVLKLLHRRNAPLVGFDRVRGRARCCEIVEGAIHLPLKIHGDKEYLEPVMGETGVKGQVHG